MPPCLADCPALAAPLVRELSGEVRNRLFTRRVTAARLLEAQLTEPAFDRAGGEDYHRLCEALEATQARFFAVYTGNLDSPERLARQKEMVRAQADFERTRRHYAPTVQTAVAESLRKHWSVHPMAQVPDTIFADVALSSPASRLARIHPVWWGRFFGRMQALHAQGHPAHGELLDVLGHLRTNTGNCTIEGAVYEWRKTRNQHWGWYRKENHRMIARRTLAKAEKLPTWYQRWAPGFLEDRAEQQRLHTLLAKYLAAADPWRMPAEQSPAGLLDGLHGRN